MAQTEGTAAQIVIVGGGAAGLSTAGVLRQRGYRAVVLERDPWRSPLYAELRAQFKLLAEAQIELQ